MVSYWIQFVLVLLITAVPLILDSLERPGPPWFRSFLEELQPINRSSNAILCLAILASAAIWIWSSPPTLLGASFIYHLITLEIAMMSIPALQLAWSIYEVKCTGWQSAYFFIFIAMFIIHIVLIGVGNPLACVSAMLETIQKDCQLHHGFVSSIPESVTVKVLDWIFTVIARGGAVISLMTFACGWPLIRCKIGNSFFDWCKAFFLRVCPPWLRTTVSKCYLFCISILLIVGLVLGLIILHWFRSTEHKLSGPLYQDNKWGFGQVMAVFMWLPLLKQAGEEVLSMPQST